LKKVVFEVFQFNVTIALNIVNGMDKNTFLVSFFQHLKLSIKTNTAKTCSKFAVNTNLRLRDKIFHFLTLANTREY